MSIIALFGGKSKVFSVFPRKIFQCFLQHFLGSRCHIERYLLQRKRSVQCIPVHRSFSAFSCLRLFRQLRYEPVAEVTVAGKAGGSQHPQHRRLADARIVRQTVYGQIRYLFHMLQHIIRRQLFRAPQVRVSLFDLFSDIPHGRCPCRFSTIFLSSCTQDL